MQVLQELEGRLRPRAGRLDNVVAAPDWHRPVPTAQRSIRAHPDAPSLLPQPAHGVARVPLQRPLTLGEADDGLLARVAEHGQVRPNRVVAGVADQTVEAPEDRTGFTQQRLCALHLLGTLDGVGGHAGQCAACGAEMSASS